MRILSQAGLQIQDLPYEKTRVYIEKDGITVKGLFDGIIFELAKYSTEEKARKAMEMLREAYMVHFQYKTMTAEQRVFLLTAQMKKNKKRYMVCSAFPLMMKWRYDMNIKDFKVGQTVYVEPTGNASRGKTPEQCIEEWEITSVGGKYIKACKNERGIFRFETTFEFKDYNKRFVEKSAYCEKNYVLYATKQEIEEKHEKNRLFREIEQRFSYGSQRDISLEQLRAIHGILEGAE